MQTKDEIQMTTITYERPALITVDRRPNILGIIALMMSSVGGLLALLQSAATMGWLLIPGGFGLALLALNLRRRDTNVPSMAVLASVAGALVALVNLAFGGAA